MQTAKLLPPSTHHALWNIHPPPVIFQQVPCLKQKFILPTISLTTSF